MLKTTDQKPLQSRAENQSGSTGNVETTTVMRTLIQNLLNRSPLTWMLLAAVAIIFGLLKQYAGWSWSMVTGSFVCFTIFLFWYTATEPATGSIRNKKKTRKKLKTREEMAIWAKLIESIPDPIIILGSHNNGPQNKLLYANKQAQSIFSINKFDQDISAIIRNPYLLEAINSVAETKGQKYIQHTERTPIERQFSVNLAWLPKETGDRGPTILAHFRDLTEQERLNRMRADFIANASHELRTPIASLMGFIETLQGPARNDEVARDRFLAIMASQGKRMTSLVDDLLSLSRVEMNAHKIPNDEIDLVSLLRSTVDVLSPLAKEQNIRLELIQPEDPFVAYGERNELAQVFQNLVHNAIKYGREDGYVRISFKNAEFDKNRQQKVCVEIKDNGLGIEAHHIPRLTERFYRVDVEESREKGGTGLGLAIVKHIITHHRGELKITSDHGSGSTFSVLLPKA